MCIRDSVIIIQGKRRAGHYLCHHIIVMHVSVYYLLHLRFIKGINLRPVLAVFVCSGIHIHCHFPLAIKYESALIVCSYSKHLVKVGRIVDHFPRLVLQLSEGWIEGIEN